MARAWSGRVVRQPTEGTVLPPFFFRWAMVPLSQAWPGVDNMLAYRVAGY